MTREQFIDKHRAQLCGLAVEMMQNVDNPALALIIRNVYRKIDILLGQAYADLQPSPVKEQTNGQTANGKPTVPAATR